MSENLFLAFGLTLLAGLATGLGSLMAFFAKRTNTRFLSVTLGFSAGAMLYISFMELFPESRKILAEVYSGKLGVAIAVLSFFGGILLTALIDWLVPSFENPHELRSTGDIRELKENVHNKKLVRMGLFSAFAIAIHNFPEGLATFTSALDNPTLGLSIAIAIAIHNIPEGMTISVPIYHATGSRTKALGLSFLSGLSEPLGAAIGYLILRPFFSDTLLGILLGSVAGIMVYISMDELLPSAREYGEHHLAIYGFISGMAGMAVSLLLL